MEMRAEKTVDLTVFFYWLNHLLRKLSGDPNYKFNPAMFICDHGGANWRAVEFVFGRDVAINKLVYISFPKEKKFCLL